MTANYASLSMQLWAKVHVLFVQVSCIQRNRLTMMRSQSPKAHDNGSMPWQKRQHAQTRLRHQQV